MHKFTFSCSIYRLLSGYDVTITVLSTVYYKDMMWPSLFYELPASLSVNHHCSINCLLSGYDVTITVLWTTSISKCEPSLFYLLSTIRIWCDHHCYINCLLSGYDVTITILWTTSISRCGPSLFYDLQAYLGVNHHYSLNYQPIQVWTINILCIASLSRWGPTSCSML